MRANWLVLGAALCAFAGFGYGVPSVGRSIAAAAVAMALALDGRRSLVLGAIVLGALGAARTGFPPPAPADPSSESAVALQLTSPGVDGRALAWMRRPGYEPVRVRVRGLGDAPLASGSRLVVRARLEDLRRRSTPDRRDAWRSARARGTRMGVVVSEVLNVFDAGRPGPQERWRAEWAAALDLRLGPNAGLWRALVLADASGLDPRARARVQDLGLSHLLALSGMHTSIVAAALLWPLRRRGRRALVMALPVLGAWVVLAGGGASIVRAVGMAGWWVCARRARRPARAEDALAGIALLELALRPHLLCGVGWWLSYSATLGVLRAVRISAGWPSPLRAIAVSVTAQLATLPWVLDAFGFVNLVAPLTLLLVGPVFAVTLVLGLGGLAAAGGSRVLAGWIDPLVASAGHAFGALLLGFAPAAGLVWRHPGLEGAGWAGALLAVAAALWPARAVGRRTRVLTVLAALAIATGLPAADHEWVAFDVGQGDAMVVRCGPEVLVVDTGPRYGGRSPAGWTLLDWMERRRIRDARVLVTHGHLDHRGGLAELLASGRVGEVIVATADTGQAWVGRLRRAAGQEGARVRGCAAGDVLELGHCRIAVLWPPIEAPDAHSNDRSLVLVWETPEGPVLFTGDLERGSERDLIASGALPRSLRWLKVAHHGGDTGTDELWLDLLRPSDALLSSGAGNRYGHPHPSVLRRLAAAGTRVHRTDVQGFVRVRWWGGSPPLRTDCGLDP